MGYTVRAEILHRAGVSFECHMVDSSSISTFPRLFLASCQVLLLFCNGIVTDSWNVHALWSHLEKCFPY